MVVSQLGFDLKHHLKCLSKSSFPSIGIDHIMSSQSSTSFDHQTRVSLTLSTNDRVVNWVTFKSLIFNLLIVVYTWLEVFGLTGVNARMLYIFNEFDI